MSEPGSPVGPGRTAWVDATQGISGDMLLGACLDAGVELDSVRAALARLDLPEPIGLTSRQVRRGGLSATEVVVHTPPTDHRRTLDDVLALLSPLDAPTGDAAAATFTALAEAEARVHRVPVEEVHFHEVGALDSIADVVGVTAAVHAFDVDRLVASTVGLGGGRVDTDHGPVPVPGPAVVELLRAHGVPAAGGPVETELATPTGVALLVTLADACGPLPALTPEVTGTGAGTRDPEGHANITRLVVGTPAASRRSPEGLATGPGTHGVGEEREVVIEANVDDLDPRLWPGVLDALLDAGASDVWLTPVLMKKGRPAHTLSVLGAPDRVATLEELVLTRTTTIGLRRHPVDKVALPRETVEVRVHGEPVRVKVTRRHDTVTSATPEFDDVTRVAVALGLAEKDVLNAARLAAAPSSGSAGR